MNSLSVFGYNTFVAGELNVSRPSTFSEFWEDQTNSLVVLRAAPQ